MKRWLNILTGLALTFIIIVGIWKSKPETLKNQPFLLDGSNGVSIAIHPWLVKLSTSNLLARKKYFSRGSRRPNKCLEADGQVPGSQRHKCKSAVCLQNTF